MVGPLGDGLAITGSWRDGYVELAFAGDWPKQSRRGAPGAIHAFLAGWIDGDSGKGRMRVEGRSDGTWVADAGKMSGSRECVQDSANIVVANVMENVGRKI